MGGDSSLKKDDVEEDIKPTRVSWGVGYTINLGNFQSLRLDITVDDQTRGEETVREASERIYRFAERELTRKVEEAKEEYK